MKAYIPGVIVQFASSISNGLLVLAISRAAPADEFGVFSLGYAILAFALGIMRSSVLDLLLIASGKDQVDINKISVVFKNTVIGTLIFSLLVVFATLYFADDLKNWNPMLLGVGIFIVLMNDFGRFAALSLKDKKSAMASDTVWLVLAVLVFFIPAPPSVKINLWLLGALLGLFVNTTFRACLVLTFKNQKDGITAPADHKKINRAFAFDHLLLSSRGLVFIIAISSVFGTKAAAIVGISQFLYQPIAAILQGLRFTYLGRFAGRSADQDKNIWIWIFTVLFAGLFWTLLIYLVPSEWAEVAIGESFLELKPYLWIVCLFQVYRLVEVPSLDWFKSNGYSSTLIAVRGVSAIGLIAISIVCLLVSAATIESTMIARLVLGVVLLVVMLCMILLRQRKSI